MPDLEGGDVMISHAKASRARQEGFMVLRI